MLIIVIFSLSLCHFANAQRIFIPFEREVSPNNEYEVIIYNERKHGKVFKIYEQCNLMWEFKVPDFLVAAHVSNDGRHVVLIASPRANITTSTAFILLEHGRVVVEYKLKELIGLKGLHRFRTSVSRTLHKAITWHDEHKKSGFTSDGGHFLITPLGGKEIIIDLSNGKMVKRATRTDSVVITSAHNITEPTPSQIKQLLLSCKMSEGTKLFLGGLKDQLIEEGLFRGGIKIWPNLAMHLIGHHTDESFSFTVRGPYPYKGYIFELLFDIYMDHGEVSIDYMEGFNNRADIIIKELDRLSTPDILAEKQIKLESSKFEVTFKIRSSQYSYIVSILCRVENDEVNWHYFKLDDVLNFISIVEKERLLDILDEEGRPIHQKVERPIGIGVFGDVTLTIMPPGIGPYIFYDVKERSIHGDEAVKNFIEKNK